jgi:GTP:adenosylcobinamide-phosphate guanylyltransferase
MAYTAKQALEVYRSLMVEVAKVVKSHSLKASIKGAPYSGGLTIYIRITNWEQLVEFHDDVVDINNVADSKKFDRTLSQIQKQITKLFKDAEPELFMQVDFVDIYGSDIYGLGE